MTANSGSEAPREQTAAAEGSTKTESRKPQKKKPVCRFYASKNGCRAGDTCRFLHPSNEGTEAADEQPPAPPSSSNSAPESEAKPDVATRPIPVRTASRPTPQIQTDDPRAFQINQVKRRFKPKISETGDATTLTFKMKPSDPDFPYDIENLECVLKVPPTYPAAGKPSLSVQNQDIPRGFQINVERGFDEIATGAPNAYLLGLVNRLDKQLESILSGEKAETIKIVANRGQPEKPLKAPEKPATAPVPAPKPAPPPKTASPPTSAAPTFSDEQRAEARAKRQGDTRQLDARFGRLQSFVKSADGKSYTLPLDSPKRSAWPVKLQPLRAVRLTVPVLYPLEPAKVHLDNDSEEARNVEAAFEKRSRDSSNATLTQQFNYLSQHLKDMSVAETPAHAESAQRDQPPADPHPAPVLEGGPSAAMSAADEDRPHVQYIPRPPEWDMPADNDGSDSDSESDFSGTDGEEHDHTDGEAGTTSQPEEQPTSGGAQVERGILLSLPHLELYGIELLQVASLSITIKCERCKDTMDIEKLRPNQKHETSCKKCAVAFAIRFRPDMIHAHSARAGFLDLDGCTVVDMLTSHFVPTCAECSTPHPDPGIMAVRGDASMAICRECHRKMSLKLPEVRFFAVSASAIRASRATGPKRAKENLGVTAGTPLPRYGRCKHYRKSYRWFRFSCCSKVFACDRCHDEQTSHPNEHANRMLCGYCSREQNYSPEQCATCKNSVIGRKGRGFWEGGQGTRNPMAMSKKDPRKYKRKPGSKPKT